MKYLIVTLFLFSCHVDAVELSADEIMQKSYETTRFNSSSAEADLSLIDKSGDIRTRKIVTSSKLNMQSLDNARLSRFIAPSDIKGMSTLLIEHKSSDDDIWVYLPSMKKVRRLSVNSKRDSFLGTDLSNGDVIGHKPNGWKHVFLREEIFHNSKCWVIESFANPKTIEQTGYTKRVSYISMENFSALKTDFWNDQSLLSKTIVVNDIKKISANKFQPLLIEAKNLLSGHQSTIKFNQFDIDVEISDQEVSPRAMEKQD